MRLIGLLDDAPVFEFERGKYIAVNPDSEQWMVMWCWFAYLGRNCDTFTKCTKCEYLNKSIILTLKLALLEIKETRAKLSSLFSGFLDDYTDFSLTESSIENIIEKNESLLEQVKESNSKAVIFDKI